jgi:phage host-nuclease inhibitor protein Gam
MTAPSSVSLDDLRRQKARLETRLEDGWNRINEGEAQGRDVTPWEDFWLDLLKEYEAVCDAMVDQNTRTNEGI